jgi:5S rRNA maturation endonuclease (ribonuclease M5)
VRAAELAAVVPGAKRRGDSGWWDARCPAASHGGDERPSLSFHDDDAKERIGLVCRKGCPFQSIVAGLGVRAADLFHSPRAAGTATAKNGHAPARPVIETTYDYRDETGALRFQAVRLFPKDFFQRRPDGRGGWINDLDGVETTVYRLDKLRGELAALPEGERLACIVEGERDADTLAAIGLPATTSPMGAGRWRAHHTAQLLAVGAEGVRVFRDADTKGEEHAALVSRLCRAAGLRVTRVILPGHEVLADKHGRDVSDWLKTHTPDELRAVLRAAPELGDEQGPDTRLAARDPRRLTLTSLQELLAEPEEDHAWLVEDRLPAGGLGLLAGKPKAGKSTAARCLALAVARGAEWLGFKTHQGEVFYLGLEEKRQEVRRHFKAMGARPDDPVRVFIAPSPEDGMAQLRAAAEAARPALIVVDPLLRFVRVRDANDYAVVTGALEPLMAIARDTGACLLAVHHMGKGERSGGDAILGSTAIFGAVDTALLLKRTEKYRTLSSTQRYGPDLEEIVVTLDEETRTVQAGSSRAEADEQQAAAAILDYLRTLSEPVEESAIREAVEVKKGVQVRALRTLVADGKVNREGAGKKGDPYRYSISGFLVPSYIREPENQKPKTAVSARESVGKGGSAEIAACAPASETPEPESEPLEGASGRLGEPLVEVDL